MYLGVIYLYVGYFRRLQGSISHRSVSRLMLVLEQIVYCLGIFSSRCCFIASPSEQDELTNNALMAEDYSACSLVFHMIDQCER